MKKHLKKLFTVLFIAVCGVCLALGLSACNDNKGGGGGGGNKGPVALTAPVLTLNGKVLSWTESEHAEAYEIYLGDTLEHTTEDATERTYTINKEELGKYVYKVRAITSDENYTNSPFSNTRTYSLTEQLAAPEIELNGTELTWSAVEHATSYWIYINGEIAEDRKTGEFTYSYNLTKMDKGGEYKYTVKAVSSDERYTDSEPSNEETFTVTALETPVITFDEDNAVIEWSEVDDAEEYVLYGEYGEEITTTTSLSYEIPATEMPGITYYTVEAVNSSISYANAKSTAYRCDVPLITSITVQIPQSAQNVLLVLYNDSARYTFNVSENSSKVRAVVPNGNYTAELEGLPDDYVSNSVKVSYNNRTTASIEIIELTNENSIKLGDTSITINFPGKNLPEVEEGDEDEDTVEKMVSVTKTLIFVAGETQGNDGVHTITAKDGDSSKRVTISANDVKVVNTSIAKYYYCADCNAELIGVDVSDSEGEPACPNPSCISNTTDKEFSYTVKDLFKSGSFTLAKGKSVVLTFVFEAVQQAKDFEVTFNINIADSAVKQYLEILSQPYKNEFEDPEDPEHPNPNEKWSERDLDQQFKTNRIIDSSIRYIKATGEAQKLTLAFSYPTLGDTTVTIKANGLSYELYMGTMLDNNPREEYCDGCDLPTSTNYKYVCAWCETELDEDATSCPNPDCPGKTFRRVGICTNCGGQTSHYKCTTCGGNVEKSSSTCSHCRNLYNIAYIYCEADEDVKVEIIFSGSSYLRHDVVSFWAYPALNA